MSGQGIHLPRIRTIRRVVRLQEAHPQNADEVIAGTGVEIKLRDVNSGLFGRADRIQRQGSSVRVVDLKTGLHQGEATESQRRQLLLYALLTQRATGQWPDSVAVEDASGLQHVISLDIEEAESTLLEVESLVESFNQKIAEGSFVDDADPSAERCRWCAFRVVCKPYWDRLDSSWGHQGSLGKVLESGNSDAGAYAVLELESPRDGQGVENKPLHISSLSEALPLDATKAAFVDWIGNAETGAVRAKWSTAIRVW